jgi:dienelactone hydrolase
MSDPKALQTGKFDYSEGGTAFEGYIARPANAAKAPCVLVGHDWSGCNEGSCGAADRLAGLGYVGIALDVYGKGVRGDQQGDNTHLMGPLFSDRALLRRRLVAGIEAAAAHPAVDASKIAMIGYCFGGLCALDLARSAHPMLKGAVSFHGIFQPPEIGPQARITAKVLVLHGWADPMAKPEAVVGLAKELTDAGADWQIHGYGHAMHAFTFEGANAPERGILYNAAANHRSWAAMQGFLQEVFA